MMHDWAWGQGFGMGHWIGGILMVLFWILVIVGLVYLVRYLIQRGGGDSSERSRGGSREGAEPSALELLKQRYARGEMSREEYLEKKKDMET